MDCNTVNETLSAITANIAFELACVFVRMRDRFQAHVENLKQAIEIPSVSSEPCMRKHCYSMMQWMKNKLEDLKFETFEIPCNDETSVDDTSGIFPLPILLGQLGDDPSKLTLCIYGTLDVPNNGRRLKPFVRGFKEESVFGPGASSNKGPIMCWLSAIEGYTLQKMPIPINIKFFLDSDSRGRNGDLKKIIQNEKDGFFENVDLLCLTDLTWIGDKIPCIIHGTKGTCDFSVEIICASKDVDAELDGGLINDAMTDMVYLLNSLSDVTGNILIPGIDAGVSVINEYDVNKYSFLEFDVDLYKDSSGVLDLLDDEMTSTLLKRKWRTPHLRIHDIESCNPKGCLETIIPGHLKADFSIYLAFDQDPAVIEKIVLKFITDQMEKRKTKNKYSAYMTTGLKPWRTSPDNKYYFAAQNAFKIGYKIQPQDILTDVPRPIVTYFSEVTKKEVIIIPLSPAEDNPGHGCEKFGTATFRKSARVLAAFIHELGKLRNS